LSCDKAHWISSLGSPKPASPQPFVGWLTRTSEVFALYFSFVLFALMKKEPKKSRPLDASPHMPTRHPAFGPGQRASLTID